MPIPSNGEDWWLRACRRINAGGIKRSSESLRLNLVGEILDRRDVRDALENVALELLVQMYVRVTTRMWDRHPSARVPASGLSTLGAKNSYSRIANPTIRMRRWKWSQSRAVSRRWFSSSALRSPSAIVARS